jgi:hypothetical protein
MISANPVAEFRKSLRAAPQTIEISTLKHRRKFEMERPTEANVDQAGDVANLKRIPRTIK